MASQMTSYNDALKPRSGIPKIRRPVLRMECSDMFFLMTLMVLCRQRVHALFVGGHWASAPMQQAQEAIQSIADQLPKPVTPLLVPLPRLMV